MAKRRLLALALFAAAVDAAAAQSSSTATALDAARQQTSTSAASPPDDPAIRRESYPCPLPKSCSMEPTDGDGGGGGGHRCSIQTLRRLASTRQRMERAQRQTLARQHAAGQSPTEEMRMAHDMHLARMTYEEAAVGCALLVLHHNDGAMGKTEGADEVVAGASVIEEALQRAERGDTHMTDMDDDGEEEDGTAMCPTPRTCVFSVAGAEGACNFDHFHHLQQSRMALEETSKNTLEATGGESMQDQLGLAESYAELASVGCVLVMQREVRTRMYEKAGVSEGAGGAGEGTQQQCQAPDVMDSI